ncbi:hypothetical protein B0I35DRAFT_422664 [Stachybotrys elegans]|uniref:Uncharacterized protein n=1 Tax=Stachybotrys elegans TaxID=80388 RepID=A0A8K0SYN5_9HYPO|nr:hypothetical protein B0I35DRAFT_422664 [Stachybotrys elegans]
MWWMATPAPRCYPRFKALCRTLRDQSTSPSVKPIHQAWSSLIPSDCVDAGLGETRRTALFGKRRLRALVVRSVFDVVSYTLRSGTRHGSWRI